MKSCLKFSDGLYRFQSNETGEGYNIEKVGKSYDLSNGMAWNRENTKFYFVDFLPKKIYVFDFNENSGVIGNIQHVCPKVRCMFR